MPAWDPTGVSLLQCWLPGCGMQKLPRQLELGFLCLCLDLEDQKIDQDIGCIFWEERHRVWRCNHLKIKKWRLVCSNAAAVLQLFFFFFFLFSFLFLIYMTTSLQTSVLQRKPETNSAFGCCVRLNALGLGFGFCKMPTDTCSHHEFAIFSSFSVKLQFSSAWGEGRHSWQEGVLVVGVLVTFHCETTPCMANKPPWVSRGWLWLGRWWYGDGDHKKALLGHPAFCLAAKLLAEAGLAANISSYLIFHLFHNPTMRDGVYLLQGKSFLRCFTFCCAQWEKTGIIH